LDLTIRVLSLDGLRSSYQNKLIAKKILRRKPKKAAAPMPETGNKTPEVFGANHPRSARVQQASTAHQTAL
jgi:hypothetical protein